jgi:CMP-N-acetylneuraminic acid synthetase
MLDGKTILVVVPARGGSKGLKLKNIYPLCGKPLIVYTGEIVQQLDYVDRAVVSTDHQEIARVAQSCGLDVPFYRPESLSGDRISDWQVLNHALREMEKLDGREYDIVLMLQPTSPLRKPEHVTQALTMLLEEDYDAVWPLSKTDSKAHPLKQLVIKDGLVDFYDPAGATIIARQQAGAVYHLNGTAYAIRRECILEKKSSKGDKTGAFVINEPVVDIDSKFDILFAEFLLSRKAEIEKSGS